MRRTPPLDFDLSVAADKARRQRARRGMSGAVEGSTRSCEWPGCGAHAAYRAPASPERLDEYLWFCLEHVREYNAGWNFFADLGEDEIEARLRAATAWERPTWRLGGGPGAMQGLHAHAEGRAWERFGMADPFEVLGENATLNPGRAANDERPRRRRRLTRLEQQAMDTLGLPHQVTARAELRARYRALVKDLHPDTAEAARDPDRLRAVLDAWDVLKASANFDD